MSSKEKKSAFSVFKGRKTTSMTNVDSSNTPATGKKANRKAASANTTPTSSSSSIAAILNSTDKKKHKSDLKKIKKLLKSGGKKRPSFLPDSAIQSPVIPNGHSLPPASKNVELRTLKPKGSMANINQYNQPFKATPGRPPSGKGASPNVGSYTEGEFTPPLPPRAAMKKNGSGVRTSTNSDAVTVSKSALKRTSPGGAKPPTPPNVPPRDRKNSENDPIRPTKRRRLSQGSAPPSPGSHSITSRKSGVISPQGSRERTEPLPLHPASKPHSQPYMFDSLEEAKRLFECLIHPVAPSKFFNELWEKKPLLVKRHKPDYNNGWFSTAELDSILSTEHIKYGENLDVVSYSSGKRETHNPPGRAHPPVVWDYYQNGCSIRMLNPQTYSRSVWKLLSIIQEYFGSCAGANVYLTPPGTQGFAPHWDDIDAFIIQLEGKKHWRLYDPRSEEETLPRYSSANFGDADIGEPILDAVVEAGDLLYFPRGVIHQGRTFEDSHSLHITVSVCQKNTWGDLMEKLVPRALQLAIDEDVEFRKSLPIDYLNYMGVAFSDKDCPQRKGFLRKIEQLMMKMMSYAPVDAASDQMSKSFIHDTLPPVLTEGEKQCSIHGNGERWHREQNRVFGANEIDPDAEIKIIRRGALRLVTEEDKVHVYHNLENARIYHAHDIQYFEITSEMAPAVEYLLHTYPNYASVDSLPCETTDERVEVACILYEKGLLITKSPLEPLSDSESEVEFHEPTQVSKKDKKKKKIKNFV